MVRLAMLGDTYPAQVRVNPRALGDLEVVWVGQSQESFRAEVPRLKPQALALDFLDLGEVPVGLVPALLESTGARHALVSYRLAHPPLVDALASPRVSFFRGPIPLSILRIHVQRGLEGMSRPAAPTAPTAAPPRPAPALALAVPPPRFTPEQLSRLLERSQRDGCGCAHQLARIIGALRGFGEYTRGCEREVPRDKWLHERLERQMLRARDALEEGLEAIIEHEHLTL